MNTRGMIEANYCFNLFESRPWYDLIPDTSVITVTTGRGTFGDIDFVCLARTANGNNILAYVPTTRIITVNMSRISGASAKAWWYNPKNGQTQFIGSFATRGDHEFMSPKGDQILVLDDASLNFRTPGKIFFEQK